MLNWSTKGNITPNITQDVVITCYCCLSDCTSW